MTTSRTLKRPDIPESIKAIQSLAIVPGILETVCRLTGMRFAAIARVTDDRWTACAVLDHLDFGLKPGGDLVLDSTICDEIRNHHQPVVFGHASHHPTFSTHHTPRIYGLESYVSVPILIQGQFFGTLCAIDTEPRDFDEGTIVGTLVLFATLIASHLSIEARAEGAEAALKAEVDTGTLRELFFAVVGHDLRSPLQGARLAAEQLEDMQTTERAQRLVRILSQSVNRMSGLVDDIMDFARGRLGGGLPLELTPRSDLSHVIEAVVAEVRQGHPLCVIDVEGSIPAMVRFDGPRMDQLLANLLNNAVTHGDPTRPVRVATGLRDGQIEIAVSNHGNPIPPELLDSLFEPFVRPDNDVPRPGLGLGLYIAAEVARGHGGALTVTSSRDAGTTFMLRLPAA